MFEDFAQKLVGLSQSPGWQQGLNQIAALRPMTKSQAAIDASQAQTRMQEREAGIKEQQAQRELLQGQFLQQFLSGDQEAGRSYLMVGGRPEMIGASQLLGQQAMEGAASQDYINKYGKGSTLPPIEGQLPPLGLTGGSMPPASPPPMPMPPAGQQMPPQAPMQAPPMQQPQPTVMAPEVQPPAPPIAAPAITGAITPATSDIKAAEARLQAASQAKITALQQKEVAERSRNQSFIGEAGAVVLQATAAEEQALREYNRTKELADQAKTSASDASKTVFTQESALRDDYTKQSEPFIAVRDAYANLRTAYDQATANPDQAGAADIQMVFAFMKSQDPKSTVREGEYATAQNSAGVPERVRQIWNKLQDGDSLSQVQRNSFLNLGEKNYKQYKAQHEELTTNFRKLAENYKVNPDNVLLNYDVAKPFKEPVPALPEPMKAAGITPEKWAQFLKKKKEAEAQ